MEYNLVNFHSNPLQHTWIEMNIAHPNKA